MTVVQNISAKEIIVLGKLFIRLGVKHTKNPREHIGSLLKDLLETLVTNNLFEEKPTNEKEIVGSTDHCGCRG